MRIPTLIAAACAALIGLAACGDGSEPSEDPDGSTEAAETEEGTSDSPAEDTGTDIDPRLEVLVGTWEADVEEVGPHGSRLTVNEDGTATYMSGANLHGPYEGEIILGDAEPHRFEGVESETGEETSLEFEFDAEADTLTLTTAGGESYVHTRTA